MRVITVKVPDSYYEKLRELVSDQSYPNMSEAIRAALRMLFKAHNKL